jgi:signal transduction histidine kinase
MEANRGYAERYGVRLRLDAPAAAAAVRADSDRLVQVITNLLSNAIKFSPRDAEVVIGIEHSGALVRMSVRDHGIGIPDHFKPRVFEKFAQADVADGRQKGGTGLGLSIVKQIVTLLGGSISFQSTAGQGTTFNVDLPQLEPASIIEGTAAPRYVSSENREVA